MTMKKHLVIISILLVCLSLFLLLACAPAPQPPAELKTLKVGCIMPFTGPAALWGQNIRPGMEIYADLINEDGGLKVGNDKYKIEMFFKDGFATGAGCHGSQEPYIRERRHSYRRLFRRWHSGHNTGHQPRKGDPEYQHHRRPGSLSSREILHDVRVPRHGDDHIPGSRSNAGLPAVSYAGVDLIPVLENTASTRPSPLPTPGF